MKALALTAVLGASPPERAEPRREWYGWQTASVDVAAGALYVGGLLADAELPQTVAAFLYVAAAPIIHAGHGSHGQALASLGIRLVLPLLGSLVALAASTRTEYGVLSGAIPAAAFDAIALAWRRE